MFKHGCDESPVPVSLVPPARLKMESLVTHCKDDLLQVIQKGKVIVRTALCLCICLVIPVEREITPGACAAKKLEDVPSQELS